MSFFLILLNSFCLQSKFYLKGLPEKLKPNQNGLSPFELEIYEDFNDKVGVLDKQFELLCESLNYGEDPRKVMDRGMMMMKNQEFCEKVLKRFFSKNEHQEFFIEMIKKKILGPKKKLREKIYSNFIKFIL